MEDIPDWLSNSIKTEITVYSTSINGKRIRDFMRQKEKEGFDRIETSTTSGQKSLEMKFKIVLTKLEPFED